MELFRSLFYNKKNKMKYQIQKMKTLIPLFYHDFLVHFWFIKTLMEPVAIEVCTL